MKKIQAVRGMNDILPDQTPQWQWLEAQWRALMQQYGYDEIRMPLVEQTQLFKRAIGDVTDIVEKEMYTFDDRNGDSLTLRPEGTAQCVRAVQEAGLLYNQSQKLWYAGPMFRHERPQKGRYRQFYQLGIEALNLSGPDIDIELLALTARLWEKLQLSDSVRLKLNSLGDSAARARYRDALVAYFSEHHDALDEDSKRRLSTNPLRILDSKNPDMQTLIAQAPVLLDYCDEAALVHFEGVCEGLKALNIPFEIDYRLVRGLDYYDLTVFEWVTDALGAQGTVCGGGRYNGLVEQLGGKPADAIGLSIGMERLLALMPAHEQTVTNVYVVVGDGCELAALQLAERCRTLSPKTGLKVNHGGGSIKSQFKRAEKYQAQWAIILDESSLQDKTIVMKSLSQTGERQAPMQFSWDDLEQMVTRW